MRWYIRVSLLHTTAHPYSNVRLRLVLHISHQSGENLLFVPQVHFIRFPLHHDCVFCLPEWRPSRLFRAPCSVWIHRGPPTISHRKLPKWLSTGSVVVFNCASRPLHAISLELSIMAIVWRINGVSYIILLKFTKSTECMWNISIVIFCAESFLISFSYQPGKFFSYTRSRFSLCTTVTSKGVPLWTMA